jgi:NAD(P)-dependent dehydrogenase (short-subunit alcohol dehydrogenase family)
LGGLKFIGVPASSEEDHMKLANKVAVITGGNSGIGLATAREFKANGAEIVIFGRSRPTLDQAAASLGDEVLAVQGDVRKLGDKNGSSS